MRVLVCGGRHYDNPAAVYAALGSICRVDGRITCVIHGGASGADNLADAWGVKNGITVESYLADWHVFGRAGGPLRNQRMLDEGKPDIVLAFPGGRGTEDMVTRAKKAGVRVLRVMV